MQLPASLKRWLLPVLALTAIFASVLWQAQVVGNFRIDDAYITFSFAKNLASGNGPVYSHGVRVEGYSNFLWMVILAIPFAFRPALDPYLTARLLTLPFALILGWATYALIRLGAGPRRGSPALAWAGVLFLAFDIDLVFAAVSALETLPFVALLTAGFALHLRGLAGDPLARRLTIPCFVAVALMRIDGFLPLAYVIAAELLVAIGERRLRLRALARWAGPGVLVFVLWFAWRWRYYGLPLPTTAYAKELIPKVLPDRGFEYARDFWTSTGLFIALPFVIAAGVGRRRFRAWELSLFILLHTAYVVRVGGDWMPFWRFLLPVTPLFIVLVMWGIDDLITRAARRGPILGAAATGLAFAVLAWMGVRVDGHAAETKVEREKLETAQYIAKGMTDNVLPVARLLGHVARPGQRFVSDYAGVMAYYTDAAVIDMWGLANREIALHGTAEGVNPIWGRTCPRCYAKLDPDYFHVPSVTGPDAFRDHRAVVNAVWQSNTIRRHVDFKKFAAGRVTNTRRKQAMFFLERRREGSVFETRRPAPHIVVEYPFESPQP